MSSAPSAPFVPSSSSHNALLVSGKIVSLRRPQTFPCSPPTGANGSNRNRNSNSNSPNNGPKRSPTFGPGPNQLHPARPRLDRLAPRPRKAGLIIAGYTCIGKSTFQKQHPALVVDLDSSAYSHGPDFPHNYLAAIREQADRGHVVLISTHQHVSTPLHDEGYYVVLVYPDGSPANKREWLRRAEGRELGGRESPLYKALDKYWDEWDKRFEGFRAAKRVKLLQTGYLSNSWAEIRSHYEKRDFVP